MGLITAVRFMELKALVQSECNRRCHDSEFEQYASNLNDYGEIIPDSVILKKLYETLVEPLHFINSEDFPSTTGDRLLLEEDIKFMEQKIHDYESYPIGADRTDSTDDPPETGCKGACIGLCFNTCTTGCMDSCSGKCLGNCGSGCSGGCSGCSGACGGSSCTGTCLYTCSLSCTKTCGSDCSNTCTNTCSDTCSGNCTNTCHDTSF